MHAAVIVIIIIIINGIGTILYGGVTHVVANGPYECEIGIHRVSGGGDVSR
jgi:hypothetical protein